MPDLDVEDATARVESLVDTLLATHDPATTDEATFLGAQFDLGLAWVHFPEGRGGLGLAPRLQSVVATRLEEAGAPTSFRRNPIGNGMAAPTILAYGSEDQKDRYLRPLFTGEEVWCQLFSEPGAGSDIAAIATRAVRDGDEWAVTGQKVWTTLAHIARRALLVARTDPDQPKHKGMTYFVLDMQASGVEVRPLFQMTGEAEFNEVFLDDVRVPDSERLGDVGDGWRVVLTTLMNERVAIGGRVPAAGGGLIGEAVELWKSSEARDLAARDELTRLWVESEVLRLTKIRADQLRVAGTPGPEGSIGKIVTAGLNQRISSFMLNLLGPHGMLKPDGYPMDRPSNAGSFANPVSLFLRVPANSIEGGTTEISKNIVAERVLGLPGDVRVDKDVPWSQVPR